MWYTAYTDTIQETSAFDVVMDKNTISRSI